MSRKLTQVTNLTSYLPVIDQVETKCLDTEDKFP